MDYCNGRTHSWSDDSYSHGSYPCPGPEKCPNSKMPKKISPSLAPKPKSGPRWDDPPVRRP